MKTLVCSCAALAVALAAVVPVLAQPAMDPSQAPVQGPTVASTPVPDTAQESPGIPSDRAVNPAPGAEGAYIGHSPKAFYDVDARIAHVEQAIAGLPPAQRKKATAMLRSIKAEEKTQMARHGGQLRDWDREHLNTRLDQLKAQVPALAS